jgi:guanine deaminase
METVGQRAFRVRLIRPLGPEQIETIEDALLRVDVEGAVVEVRAWSVDDEGSGAQDLRPLVVTPGFVDTHLHFPQTRVIGSASGPLLAWLERSVFPEETKFSSAEYASEVAGVFVERMLASGTTSSLTYGSVHADACDRLFEAAARAGVRMIAGPVLMESDAPPALRLEWARAVDGLERLRERWHDPQGRLQLAVIPRFALSCTESTLSAAGAYARDHGLITTTHIAETKHEYRETCERFGSSSYLEVYDRNGLIEAGTVLAHCIHLRDAEWDRMAEIDAVVAHCPDSNDFLGSGSMPVTSALDRGVRVSIATDVAAGRTFSIPATLAAAFDNGQRVGIRISLARLLWWGTAGGAAALGQAPLGTLAEGAPADFVVHRVAPWVSVDEALAAILFDRDASVVERVYVAGRPVWSR